MSAKGIRVGFAVPRYVRSSPESGGIADIAALHMCATSRHSVYDFVFASGLGDLAGVLDKS